jgi:hypothetical protein
MVVGVVVPSKIRVADRNSSYFFRLSRFFLYRVRDASGIS